MFTVLKNLHFRTEYRHQSCRNPELAAGPAVAAQGATVAVAGDADRAELIGNATTWTFHVGYLYGTENCRAL